MSAILNFLKKAPVQKTIWIVFLVAVSLLVTKIVLKIYDKFTGRSKLDPLVGKILRVVLKILLLFLSVIIVLASLGISVSAFVATLSVVGVAFSLAIQDFLSNVFGGIQIITNKPFQKESI